jgi:molecular chaperone GrpE
VLLAEAKKEKEDLYDQLLRRTAEFENYRKRIEREGRERSNLAAADIIFELLAVIDDLERAVNTSVENNTETYRQGVELILRQMLELLRKRDVKPIEALGVDFDPNYHEAVVHELSPDHKGGEVIEELRRGYMIGGRLLRPAMVKVAKPS